MCSRMLSARVWRVAELYSAFELVPNLGPRGSGVPAHLLPTACCPLLCRRRRNLTPVG
jgi:hypothetical protein